jgi:hypothetical protein
MPFYRVKGMLVHLKLGKGKRPPPAPCCAPIELDGKRQRCMAISGYLCDWETGPGETCSRPLCGEHAAPVGPEQHLCPEHAARRAERAQAGLCAKRLPEIKHERDADLGLRAAPAHPEPERCSRVHEDVPPSSILERLRRSSSFGADGTSCSRTTWTRSRSTGSSTSLVCHGSAASRSTTWRRISALTWQSRMCICSGLQPVEGCTAQALCERLAAETGYRVATVDTVLWRACANGVLDSCSGEIRA